MKVFKFGGASVSSIDRIINTAAIVKEYAHEKLLIVVSAMGKTTNALEKVAEAFFAGNKTEALALFDAVKQQHLDTSRALLNKHAAACENRLRDFFTEVEWLLHDEPVREYDYYYDQIVCCGELLSTSIFSFFLEENGTTNYWMDVRDIFRTDDDFRDAEIDWNVTQSNVSNTVVPVF